MFAFEMRKDATNKSACGSVGWCSLPEPYGSGFSGVFGRDPAAAGFPPHTQNFMFIFLK